MWSYDVTWGSRACLCCFVSQAECEHVTCLGRFGFCVHFTWPAWVWLLFLSPTLGVFVSNERLGLQKKRLVLHGLCFVFFHCTFKIELSVLCSSFNNCLKNNCWLWTTCTWNELRKRLFVGSFVSPDRALLCLYFEMKWSVFQQCGGLFKLCRKAHFSFITCLYFSYINS